MPEEFHWPSACRFDSLVAYRLLPPRESASVDPQPPIPASGSSSQAPERLLSGIARPCSCAALSSLSDRVRRAHPRIGPAPAVRVPLKKPAHDWASLLQREPGRRPSHRAQRPKTRCQSVGCARACSGDMYRTVPITMPGSVCISACVASSEANP